MRRLAVAALAAASSLSILALPGMTGRGAAVVAASGPTVGLVQADGDYVDDVRDKLVGTGRFSSVTEVDAGSVTPSLATLEQYDSLLVWPDSTFSDPMTLGDELAQYVDDGGRLVVATFAWDLYFGLQDSTLGAGGYLPFTFSGDARGGVEHHLVADDSASPLLAGVASFDGGRHSFGEEVGLARGAVQVAHWEDGVPLVATQAVDSNTVIGLNFWPVSNDGYAGAWDTSTDGATLMANALDGGTAPTPSSPPPPQRGASFIQVSVSPDPVDASGPVTASASVSPHQAGGTVQFSLDGDNVGDPVPLAGPNNPASIDLPGPFTAGKHLVGATYSGDAHYNGSFNNYQFSVNPGAGPAPTPTPTGDVVNPTITATPLSGHPASAAGWYRSPVMVVYHCTEGSAALDTDGCPSPDSVTTDGTHTFTRTVTATDGGSASVTTTIKLDGTSPELTVHGVTARQTYKHPRTITCTATDATSGLAGPCTVTTRHRHHHHIHYKATAADNAGNTTKIKGHYTLSG